MSKRHFLKLGNSMTLKELKQRVSRFRSGDSVIFASVVPGLARELKKLSKQKKISLKEIRVRDIPLRMPYQKTLGVDRALNVFAASRIHPRTSFVVLDFGTATTIEFYHFRKGYLGGWICPGLGIFLEALALKTAKLPQLKFRVVKKRRAGRTTADSMLQAANAGIEGLLSETKKFAGSVLGPSAYVFITGGGASDMMPMLRRHFLRPRLVSDLILRGLREL